VISRIEARVLPPRSRSRSRMRRRRASDAGRGSSAIKQPARWRAHGPIITRWHMTPEKGGHTGGRPLGLGNADQSSHLDGARRDLGRPRPAWIGTAAPPAATVISGGARCAEFARSSRPRRREILSIPPGERRELATPNRCCRWRAAGRRSRRGSPSRFTLAGARLATAPKLGRGTRRARASRRVTSPSRCEAHRDVATRCGKPRRHRHATHAGSKEVRRLSQIR